MDKSNLELFKQAISEGLANRFDSVVDSYTDEIVCSENHNIAMKTIVYGKTDNKRAWSPRMKRIVAILVATALLLASCGIIFRNELREIFEDFFIMLTYKSDDAKDSAIENVYQLGYLPDGYYLKDEKIRPVRIQYEYTNGHGDYIWFEQKSVDGTDFFIDNEQGYSRINEISNYEVYHRNVNEKHIYVWNDSKYSMNLTSNKKISNEEVVLILDSIIIK